jgi:dihydroxyacetone kinase
MDGVAGGTQPAPISAAASAPARSDESDTRAVSARSEATAMAVSSPPASWHPGGVSHFLDDRAAIVTEALDAEIALADGALVRLDGYPAIKVILRADIDPVKVAVVSGGGAGHEPAHAGFVGDGLLTAAVCGEIFASPSVDAVLAAIVAVTGPAGCLLVVKSYTGDRLNFGLAAERARALGLLVEMAIVGDDVALPDSTRPRGIAGTLLVHKVAGHVARAGGSLAEVKRAAETAAASAVSIGVALSSCSVPGQAAENRIAEGQVEIGLGIHGEPGAKIVALPPVLELGATLIAMLEDALDARGHTGAPVALLVNDLGGAPALEMALATRAAIAGLRRHELRLVLGPARAMTSLAMNGFSLTLVPLGDPAIEAALRSPVGPHAWPVARAPRAVATVPLPEAVRAKVHTPSANPARRELLERACQALVSKQAELDALDARVGDGDTGTTLATAARAILADLDQLPFASLPELFAALSERLARVMGGSSGILLSIFTAAVGAHLAATPVPAAPGPAFGAGLQRMQQYGGAKPGDRTMIDALAPAIAALGETASVDLASAARAAAEGAARTATMIRAGAGRSSYVREDALRGVPDPGAVAVAAVLAALAGAGD